MGIVVKRPSRMQWQCFFGSWTGRATIFGWVQNYPGRCCPHLDLTLSIVRRGGLNVRRGALATTIGVTKTRMDD